MQLFAFFANIWKEVFANKLQFKAENKMITTVNGLFFMEFGIWSWNFRHKDIYLYDMLLIIHIDPIDTHKINF